MTEGSGIGRLDHACQTGRHSHAERGLDLYETPESAVEALLHAEALPLTVWEPACGCGAIVRMLRARVLPLIGGPPQSYRWIEK